MIKVLVISDTHISSNESLPLVIEEEAKKSNCCLHAGDFIVYEVFKMISRWTKVYGVRGNMDGSQVKDKLPAKQIIKLDKIKLGLIHGLGAPSGLIPYIKKEFLNDEKEIDIFVFGHSHLSFDREIDGKIYFNPGSLTDKTFAPYRSYGILEIEGKEIKRRIVKVE